MAFLIPTRNDLLFTSTVTWEVLKSRSVKFFTRRLHFVLNDPPKILLFKEESSSLPFITIKWIKIFLFATVVSVFIYSKIV